MRTGRMPVPVLYGEDYRFQPGRGSILREGEDVTLMGLGIMVHACMDAAQILGKEGISARVLNLSCLKPLDWELVVDSARRTGCVVTAEEHMIAGGLGSAVCEALSEFHPTPVKRVGVRDVFGLSGKPEILLKHYGLTPQDIAAAARKAMDQKNRAYAGNRK